MTKASPASMSRGRRRCQLPEMGRRGSSSVEARRPTLRARRRAISALWAGFCLLVGWAAAVLLLYGIGLLVDPLVVATLGYFGWRWRLIPEAMLGFGAGVSLALVPFLVGNLKFLDDPLLVLLAIAGIAAGPLISIVGALLMIQPMRGSSS